MEVKVEASDTALTDDQSKRLVLVSNTVNLNSFVLVVAAKIVIMVLLSSGYMDQLFIPFVRYFVSTFTNPWDYFFHVSAVHDQFPYQPLMLYVLTFACLPLKVLGWQTPLLVNFFIKLPTLLSDIAIAYLLAKIFPNHLNRVFWYYFLSPIVLYACYVHSQLDLIPTALLFGAAYFLRQHQNLKAAFLMGLALATKTHVAAALPLFLIYSAKNRKPPAAALLAVCALLTMAFFVVPYLHSAGFQALVLHNPKQNQIFEAYLAIGSMQIYLPIFAVCMVFGRFVLYPKINNDLLDAFLTIVFALFVLLIVPAPGWYVWIAPFLSLFMIKYGHRDSRIVPSCFVLYGMYLTYFLFFHRFDYVDLTFCSHPLAFKIASSHLSSVFFTMLEATLLALIILFYRIGVRSNSSYSRDKAVVIGIGGDSGAGKSTLLSDLKSMLHERVVELEGDADHKWERHDENWKSRTHLDPKANFLHRQSETIFNLKRGRAVERVDYDHTSGAFTKARMIEPNDFIVISGLHTFYLPKARKLIDLKIFMEPEASLRAHWKQTRDKNERGYSEQQVSAQLDRRKTDSDKFIAPQRDFADLCIHYYAANDLQKFENEPKLCLKLSLSSSLHLENLVQELMNAGLLLHWDYNQNLSKQDLTLSEPVDKELLQKFVTDMLPNIDELMPRGVDWEEGFRGFVQLIILLILNDLMKEKDESYGY